MNLGSLAAAREQQILDVLMEKPDITFTAKGITDHLFEGRKVKQEIYDAYSVACEDLARKQILKRLASQPSNAVRYVKPE